MKHQVELVTWNKFPKVVPSKEWSSDTKLVHVDADMPDDQFVTVAVWKDGEEGWDFYWFDDESRVMSDVYAWADLPKGWSI